MKYSIDMQIGQLSENGDAVAIFDKYLPGVREMIAKNPQSAGLSIRNLVKYMGERYRHLFWKEWKQNCKS